MGSALAAGEPYRQALFIEVDQEIVLLHGFIKKTQRAPREHLDVAKKRKKLYLQAYEQNQPPRK